MARIRSIKPDFWSDEKLTECSMAARLFFIGTWNFADDSGNLVYSTKKLKMQIFPGEEIDCQPLIDELLAKGVMQEYEVAGKAYLHISGFRDHQVINKPSKSAIPTPPAAAPTPLKPDESGADPKELDAPTAPVQDDSTTATVEPGTPPVTLQEDSGSTPVVLPDGREGKGENLKPNPPIPPKGGEPKERKKREARPLQDFLDECKDQHISPIADDDPVVDYAAGAGIPNEFLDLQWREFKARYRAPDSKKYKRWPVVFGKSVRGNWFKLWYFDNHGNCVLTTVGIQARNTHKGAA
jgi:hypothetical protein